MRICGGVTSVHSHHIRSFWQFFKHSYLIADIICVFCHTQPDPPAPPPLPTMAKRISTGTGKRFSEVYKLGKDVSKECNGITNVFLLFLYFLCPGTFIIYRHLTFSFPHHSSDRGPSPWCARAPNGVPPRVTPLKLSPRPN